MVVLFNALGGSTSNGTDDPTFSQRKNEGWCSGRDITHYSPVASSPPCYDESASATSTFVARRPFPFVATHGMRNEIKASGRQSLLFETKNGRAR